MAGDHATTEDFHPFRVRRRDPSGPPLTEPQQRVLTALVAAGGEPDARSIAERAGLRLGSVVVILRSLAKRRLVIVHPPEEPGAAEAWAPTLIGHTRVRHFRNAAPAPDAQDARAQLG